MYTCSVSQKRYQLNVYTFNTSPVYNKSPQSFTRYLKDLYNEECFEGIHKNTLSACSKGIALRRHRIRESKIIIIEMVCCQILHLDRGVQIVNMEHFTLALMIAA